MRVECGNLARAWLFVLLDIFSSYRIPFAGKLTPFYPQKKYVQRERWKNSRISDCRGRRKRRENFLVSRNNSTFFEMKMWRRIKDRNEFWAKHDPSCLKEDGSLSIWTNDDWTRVKSVFRYEHTFDFHPIEN